MITLKNINYINIIAKMCLRQHYKDGLRLLGLFEGTLTSCVLAYALNNFVV